MFMCSKCGTWLIRKFVCIPPFICYYYDYCPKCEKEAQTNEDREN